MGDKEYRVCCFFAAPRGAGIGDLNNEILLKFFIQQKNQKDYQVLFLTSSYDIALDIAAFAPLIVNTSVFASTRHGTGHLGIPMETPSDPQHFLDDLDSAEHPYVNIGLMSFAVSRGRNRVIEILISIYLYFFHH